MTKKKSLLPDKKAAPKKTGKRGIKPLDPEADFNEPTRKLETLSTITTKQEEPSLLANNPPKPKVFGSRFEAFYLKPEFNKSTKGVISLALPFTVVLDKEHKGLLPEAVASGYSDAQKPGRAGSTLKDIPGQRVEIFISHDAKHPLLVLPNATLIKGSVRVVERKGEGSARKVFRLSFQAQVVLSTQTKNDQLTYFAEKNLQNSFWIKIEQTDPALFEKDEEE
jgi:hypothetical protein